MKRINLITTDRASFPDLESENQNMIRSLEETGFRVSVVSWHQLYDQLEKGLKCDDVCLIRTVWDYPDYFDKFKKFIDLLKKRNVVTVNPSDIIEWNMNKTYLFDLQSAHISIVPCEFYPAGSTISERKVKSVVKPVVGLGARGAEILDEGQTLNVSVDSIVNPFRNSIYKGELSIVMVFGRPVLYIQKKPLLSDWRVQPQYGGQYSLIDAAPQGALKVSEKLYKYIHEKFQSDYLLFMRIDLLLNDEDQSWEILEFEAIDPSLYGAISPKAVNALSFSLGKMIE